LQSDGLLVRFLNERAGGTNPSPAILGKIGREYVEAVNAFAKINEIPVVRFHKGAVKEDVARGYFRDAEKHGRTGMVMIGVTQEKAFAWRGWRDGGNDAHPHFEFGRQAIFVTTSASTFSTRSGVRDSSRPTRTPPTRSGSTSTGMSGPNAKPRDKGSATGSSTTGFAPARTPSSSPKSAPRCRTVRSKRSWTGGCACCRHRSPGLIVAVTATG